MNHAKLVAGTALEAFPLVEFRVDEDAVTVVDSKGVSADSLKLLAARIAPDSATAYSGLLACIPLDDRNCVVARSTGQSQSVLCHVVPNDRLRGTIDELHQATTPNDKAPTLKDLDRLEPLLRCITSNQRVVVYGCTPQSTISTTWQLIPPSCRHELTFAAPPFKQSDTHVFFSPCFDPTQLGPDRASVLLDLSGGCPIEHIGETSCGWPLAIHGQLLKEDPQKALQVFFDSHCSSAKLSDLEDLSRSWCQRKDASVISSQMAMAHRLASTVQRKSDFARARPNTSVHVTPSAFPQHADDTLPNDPVIDQLGQLDDAVFAAIAGAEDGLARMRELWPAAKAEISTHLIDESREHYLRYVVNEWTQRFGDQSDPAACVPTLEVMRILLGSDQ